MQKYNPVFIFFLSAIVVFTATVEFKAQDKEIESIVNEVSVDTQKGAIFSYTYLMKFSYERHRALAGRKFTRLYEAILPSRFSLARTYQHPFVLLKDSERNLTDEQIMKSRREIAKELEKAENEEEKSTTQTEIPREDGGYWTMGFSDKGKRIEVDILEILKKSRLGNLQRRQIDGRSIVSIDFTANPSAVFKNTLVYLSKLEGQILIDETDKRIIRVEGYAPKTFAAFRDKPETERHKEMVFFFLQTKVAEGFWFPHTVRLNFGRQPEIFDPIEIEFSFSNYKRASVDVKEQIASPKNEAEEGKDTDTKLKEQ